MPYSQFTLSKAKKAFDLTIVEDSRFFPEIESISPSLRLASELEDLPWAIAVGSEKARSESLRLSNAPSQTYPQSSDQFILWTRV